MKNLFAGRNLVELRPEDFTQAISMTLHDHLQAELLQREEALDTAEAYIRETTEHACTLRHEMRALQSAIRELEKPKHENRPILGGAE